MHAYVFDAGRIKPDIVVGARFWCDVANVLAIWVGVTRSAIKMDGLVAAMLPHPIWQRVPIAVTKSVNDDCDASKIAPAWGESVVPAQPSWSIRDHGIS